jgi:hypothetical protein
MSPNPRLDATREQVLAFRRRTNHLDERLHAGAASLRLAAWCGMQDSMPRAALLSIHARVQKTTPSTWEHPSLVQLWGPRYSVFVVPARDHALFSLGRRSDDETGRRRADDLAAQLKAFLGGRRLPYGEVGLALDMNPNRLRYAAETGTVLIRWEGARASSVWTVPAPEVDPWEARLELARRYLHVYGPTTAASFGRWSGIGPRAAAAAFEALSSTLTPVMAPIGESWILSGDEALFRSEPRPPAPARLLPSGDAYTLLQGLERELLLPNPSHRGDLWTPRVWPGALLVGGKIVGTWRRADNLMSVSTWRPLAPHERDAVVAEAESLPLPGLTKAVVIRWSD